jgi:hypothetical protein
MPRSKSKTKLYRGLVAKGAKTSLSTQKKLAGVINKVTGIKRVTSKKK